MSSEKVINIQDLTFDDHNYNRGTEKGHKLMRKSFERFGAGRSILLDKDNRIIAGNKSTQAAQESGFKKVRVIETDGTELIAVKRTDIGLDSKEGRELALADNATTYSNLDWNIEELQQSIAIIDDFNVSEWDVNVPDLSQEGLKEVFTPSFEPAPQEEPTPTPFQRMVANVVEDTFIEEQATNAPIAQYGDIWQLGENRLMCGDSTSTEDVAKLMNGQQAQCVLTDPPFGNNVGYGRGQLGERRIMNDEDTNVLTSFFHPLDNVLENNTHCLIWVQWRTFPELVQAFAKYKLRTVVIWDKKQAGLSGGGFAEQYEMLCVFIKGHAVQNYYSGNVWQVSREHDKRSESEHPHKKPIEVLARAIDLCSKEDDLVLDLFGGSGSTMIACEQMNRKCYMMGLSPHYCDVIIKRYETFTGRKAVKL